MAKWKFVLIIGLCLIFHWASAEKKLEAVAEKLETAAEEEKETQDEDDSITFLDAIVYFLTDPVVGYCFNLPSETNQMVWGTDCQPARYYHYPYENPAHFSFRTTEPLDRWRVEMIAHGGKGLNGHFVKTGLDAVCHFQGSALHTHYRRIDEKDVDFPWHEMDIAFERKAVAQSWYDLGFSLGFGQWQLDHKDYTFGRMGYHLDIFPGKHLSITSDGIMRMHKNRYEGEWETGLYWHRNRYKIGLGYDYIDFSDVTFHTLLFRLGFYW